MRSEQRGYRVASAEHQLHLEPEECGQSHGAGLYDGSFDSVHDYHQVGVGETVSRSNRVTSLLQTISPFQSTKPFQIQSPSTLNLFSLGCLVGLG